MTHLVDRALGLRWLASARRATLAAQVALMVFAETGTELHLHSPALFALLAAWGGFDLLQALWLRERPAAVGRVGLVAAVDLAALTVILVLSGGQHNPLLFGYLGYLALLGMLLSAPQAWAAAAAAMVLQAFVVFHPASVSGLLPDEDNAAHLIGHVVTFDLSAAAITWVVTRLSAALRAKSAAEKAAQHQDDVRDRLAALGTLAAGVAHELGTPLGAIQLLAEQARRRGGGHDFDAPLNGLLEQVARCRSILHRLRGRDTPGAATCRVDLAAWVLEWRRAAPEVAVRLPATLSPFLAQGAEESWRGAVWVALDNARRAGARSITLSLHVRPGAVELHIDDDGRGLDAGAARHAGEPFWSGTDGTGLGLFVSRSFAQSVGGDVVLEAAEGGGARTRILIPEVQP
jgi:two-component system sensor histidine kinase RegB